MKTNLKTSLAYIGLGGLVVYLMTKNAAASPPPPPPQPGPLPGPAAPLPPVLQQGLDQLLTQAAQNPAAVDPNQMDAFAAQLDAQGFPAQAAQVRQAAAIVRARQGGLPPIPPQQ